MEGGDEVRVSVSLLGGDGCGGRGEECRWFRFKFGGGCGVRECRDMWLFF